MTIRRARRGTGITARDVLVLNGSASDIRDTLRYADSRASFEGWIKEVEESARAILAATSDQSDDSPAHYAQRIVRHIGIVRAALAKGDAGEAAYYAVMLGHLVCEAYMKLMYERFTVMGATLSKQKSCAAKAKIGKNDDRNVAMAKEFRRKCRNPYEDAKSTEIMVAVGRLPRFNLKRSAAIAAIKSGLRHHSMTESGLLRKMD